MISHSDHQSRTRASNRNPSGARIEAYFTALAFTYVLPSCFVFRLQQGPALPGSRPLERYFMSSIQSLKIAIQLLGVCAFSLASMAFAQDAPAQATHGIVVGNMDRSVKPGDNFFEYADGDWIKRTVIPPDRARIGVFSTLGDLSDKRTAALIEEAAKGGATASSSEQNRGPLQLLYGRGCDREQRPRTASFSSGSGRRPQEQERVGHRARGNLAR